MSSSSAIVPSSDGTWGVSVNGSDLVRYPPEPQNTAGDWASSAAKALSSTAGAVLGPIGSAATGDFSTLLAQQIQVQNVMQTVSMQSNIERSKHETEMTPIRNMRVG